MHHQEHLTISFQEKHSINELNIVGWKKSIGPIRTQALPPAFINLLNVCDDIVWVERDLRVVRWWEEKNNFKLLSTCCLCL